MENREFGYVDSEIMRDPEIAPETKAVYAYLEAMTGGDKYDYYCDITINDLCNELGVSEKQAYKSIDELLGRGILGRVIEIRGTGKMTCEFPTE